MKNQIFAIFIASFVAACATLTVTGTAVPEGEPRPAVSQNQVGIYSAAPENSTKVGTIEVVASKSIYEDVGAMNLLISEFEKQAANIGANGFVQTTKKVDPKTGYETYSADAIFVPKTKSGL